MFLFWLIGYLCYRQILWNDKRYVETPYSRLQGVLFLKINIHKYRVSWENINLELLAFINKAPFFVKLQNKEIALCRFFFEVTI